MDDAFIVVSVISGVFGILGLMLLDRNWFRRERFKTENMFNRKKQDLQFKKLAKDMGLNLSSKNLTSPVGSNSPMDTVSMLLPFLKQLAPEQIGDLIGIFTNKPGEEEEEQLALPAGLNINGLLEFAEKNPEIAKGFIEEFTKSKGSPGQTSDLY